MGFATNILINLFDILQQYIVLLSKPLQLKQFTNSLLHDPAVCTPVTIYISSLNGPNDQPSFLYSTNIFPLQFASQYEDNNSFSGILMTLNLTLT